MQAHEGIELTHEEFLDEIERFDKTTLEEIFKILDKDKYAVQIEVFGLINAVRILIDRYGDESLKDVALKFLETPIHKDVE